MYVCQNDRELCESETASSSTMENERKNGKMYEEDNYRGKYMKASMNSIYQTLQGSIDII